MAHFFKKRQELSNGVELKLPSFDETLFEPYLVSKVVASVTRLGNLLNFGQLFKAFDDN